jgi:ubiquinone/menaquinone biosynthesis C-methylase UbiE
MSNATFDKVYFFYDIIEKYILKDYQRASELINRHLTSIKNEKIADIGGGTGIIAELLVKKGNEVTIIDPSIGLLSKVRNPSIPLIRGDGCSMPIKDGVFDTALLINTLHHIKKREKKRVLSETLRILRCGGKLFVIDLSLPDAPVKKIFAKLDGICSGGKTHYFSPSQLNSELTLIGFNKIKIFSSMKKEKTKEQKWVYASLAIK